MENLPDVVPDQSRLTEEENTEVGAVCISLFTDTVYNFHRSDVIYTLLFLQYSDIQLSCISALLLHSVAFHDIIFICRNYFSIVV